MSGSNGNRPKCLDTSRIHPAEILKRALETEGTLQVLYLRDVTVDSKRGTGPEGGTITIRAPDPILKSVRGKIEDQQLVPLLIVLPAPHEPPLIITPGEF